MLQNKNKMDGVKMFLISCIRSQFTRLMVFPVSAYFIFLKFLVQLWW